MTELQLFPVRKNWDDKKQKWSKVPAIDKGLDWREYRGDIKGSDNYGVVVPQGIAIIDIDTQKGVTTDDVDNALGCSLDWDSAEIQQTISGGMHYAFSIDTNITIRQGSDLLGVIGFDTRTTGKGWFCAGDGYQDLTMTGLPNALFEESWPSLPVEAVSALSVELNDSADDDLMSLVNSEKLDISTDDIENYLSLLTDEHAEDSDTWLKVGMAIYHQSGGSEHGWQLFDKFSQLSPEKYDEDTNFKRWESFGRGKKNNPVTFASVIDLVGGRNAVSQLVVQNLSDNIDTVDEINDQLRKLANSNLDNLQIDTALKKIQKRYKQLVDDAPGIPALKKELKRLREHNISGDFIEDYVYLTGTGEYMNRETKTTMGFRAFNVKHNRETPPNSDGESQAAASYADNTIECVHASMYVPAFGDIFSHGNVDYFNTYRSNGISKKKDKFNIVERVKGHIKHLLPNKDEQELVINYLAHNVQLPGVKIQWAMLLQGVQGDGKSLLAEMMQMILGVNNVRVMNPQTLESSFTGWSVGQCMTFIEELKIDNYRKYEVINNIKPYITNSTIEVTKKGQDPQVNINTTNYFALTNFKDAIPIDENDRRYCILFSQWQSRDKLVAWMEENDNYYPSLYEDMRSNIWPVFEWLNNHKIPESFKAMKRAPITNAKNMMINLSKSDMFLIVEDAINEFECEHINKDIVNVTLLNNKVSDNFGEEYRDFPKTSSLKNILVDMGYHNVGRYKNDDRKNQLIYAKDDTKKASDFK